MTVQSIDDFRKALVSNVHQRRHLCSRHMVLFSHRLAVRCPYWGSVEI